MDSLMGSFIDSLVASTAMRNDIWPHSLMDRITDSGSVGRGSNPLGVTTLKASQLQINWLAFVC